MKNQVSQQNTNYLCRYDMKSVEDNILFFSLFFD